MWMNTAWVLFHEFCRLNSKSRSRITESFFSFVTKYSLLHFSRYSYSLSFCLPVSAIEMWFEKKRMAAVAFRHSILARSHRKNSTVPDSEKFRLSFIIYWVLKILFCSELYVCAWFSCLRSFFSLYFSFFFVFVCTHTYTTCQLDS